MNKTIRILLFGLLFFSCSEESTTIERQFLPLKINETSGLEYYNNNFLTHNDSGGKTILYEFNKEGKIVDEHLIENCGENNDWEDITADNENIYVANSGNNFGNRENLSVLILDKKNSFQCKGQIQFRYKKQNNFEKKNRHPYDSEGIISVGDELIYPKKKPLLNLEDRELKNIQGTIIPKKKPIEQINAVDLGVDTKPRIEQIKVEEPPKRKAGIKVASVEELVQKLKNEAKVI